MRIKSKLNIIELLVVIFGIRSFKNEWIESAYQSAEDVTIIQLIATSDKYHGQLVWVIASGSSSVPIEKHIMVNI